MTASLRSITLWLLAMPLILTATPGRGQGVMQVRPEGVKAIAAAPLLPAPLGDPHADVTVVEYFDFNCPVCRKTDPELHRLLASDPHVRLIYKNWPIFGAASVYAAYCSFAAADLGHYENAHRALMSSRERLDSNAAVEAALRQAGLDLAAIRADIEAHRHQFSATLTRNQTEATALGLRGTPGLLVGDQLVPGGLQLEQLRLLVARARHPAPATR